MPKITELPTKFHGAKYITCMDVLKGFHQNRVKENRRGFLRIISHLDVHEYLQMPFGIKNAPSKFQRMIDKEFRLELSQLWLIIYIDDILYRQLGISLVQVAKIVSQSVGDGNEDLSHKMFVWVFRAEGIRSYREWAVVRYRSSSGSSCIVEKNTAVH